MTICSDHFHKIVHEALLNISMLFVLKIPLFSIFRYIDIIIYDYI